MPPLLAGLAGVALVAKAEGAVSCECVTCPLYLSRLADAEGVAADRREQALGGQAGRLSSPNSQVRSNRHNSRQKWGQLTPRLPTIAAEILALRARSCIIQGDLIAARRRKRINRITTRASSGSTAIA